MGGSEDLTDSEIGWNFLVQHAAVVVLRVNNAGLILFANRYAGMIAAVREALVKTRARLTP
jgi:hypothetical protein